MQLNCVYTNVDTVLVLDTTKDTKLLEPNTPGPGHAVDVFGATTHAEEGLALILPGVPVCMVNEAFAGAKLYTVTDAMLHVVGRKVKTAPVSLVPDLSATAL